MEKEAWINKAGNYELTQEGVKKIFGQRDYSPVIKELREEIKKLSDDNISSGKDMEFVGKTLIEIKKLIEDEQKERKKEIKEIKTTQARQGTFISIGIGVIGVISTIAPFIWDLIIKK